MTEDKKAIDKWSEVHEGARAILQFLEWMRHQGYVVMEKKTLKDEIAANNVNLPDPDNPDDWQEVERTGWYGKDASDLDLVYEFFDIDPIELEMGRRKMLEFFQNQNDS